MNPLAILFFKIRFNIVLPCTRVSSKRFLLSDFRTKMLYAFICLLPHTCRMSRPSHRPWFDTRMVSMWWQMQITKSLIMQFLQSPAPSSSLVPNVLPSTTGRTPSASESYFLLFVTVFSRHRMFKIIGSYFSFDDRLLTNPFRKTQL